MKLKLTLVAVLPASLLTALPAGAHHSSAMFDSDQELRLEGVVTRWDYLNPHSWLYVNVENEDGSVTEWGFESDSPPAAASDWRIAKFLETRGPCDH